LEDLPELGKTDPVFDRLAKIVESNNGLWCEAVEKLLLEEGR